MLTGGRDGSAGIGPSTLLAVVSVVVSVFLPQSASTRAALRLSMSASSSTDSMISSVTNSARAAIGIVFVFVDTQFELYVEFGVHRLPPGLITRGNYLPKSVSCS